MLLFSVHSDWSFTPPLTEDLLGILKSLLDIFKQVRNCSPGFPIFSKLRQ